MPGCTHCPLKSSYSDEDKFRKLIYASRTVSKCQPASYSVCASMCEMCVCSMCEREKEREEGGGGRQRKTINERESEKGTERDGERYTCQRQRAIPALLHTLDWNVREKTGGRSTEEDCGGVLMAPHEWKRTELGEKQLISQTGVWGNVCRGGERKPVGIVRMWDAEGVSWDVMSQGGDLYNKADPSAQASLILELLQPHFHPDYLTYSLSSTLSNSLLGGWSKLFLTNLSLWPWK